MDVKPGYKQTEVGEIPEDWHLLPLGSLCEVVAGRDLIKSEFSQIDDLNHPFPIYSNALTNKGLYGYSSSYQYDSDKITVTARGDIGHAIYRDSKFSAIGRLLVLSSKKPLNLRYLSEFINNNVEFALESTGVPQLTAPQISKYFVAFPPTKAEQDAIAEVLRNVDSYIESLEQLVTKKRQIKQGALQELLRPKEGWIEKRLGSTASLKARIGWQGLTTSEYMNDGDYFLVTGTEFKDGYVEWSNCHFVTEARYKQDKNIQLREQDVLVTKDGTIGKVAFVNYLEKPATLNSGVFVIRPINNAFHSEFFYYLLTSDIFIKFLNQLSAGSTINHLYQKDFVNFVYRTPKKIDEQETIATILRDLDEEISLLEVKLNKARQIKQGVMQALLTGRMRLI